MSSLLILFRQHHHCTQTHKNAVFWPNVNKDLAKMRQEGPDEVISCIASLLLHSACIQLTSHPSVLQIMYEDDIKVHGDPAKSQFKTGNGVGTGSPKWLQHLHALAPLVQRFSQQQGTKRRRPADFNVSNEDEEEDNRDGDEEPNRESSGDNPDHAEGDGEDESTAGS
jgi:hypothetical protein